jgi:enamine deaminase RidA (YjgF/YER057c/UK114 family)
LSSSPDDRIRQLGLALPPAAPPLASYVPLVVTGRLVFVSGHGPLSAEQHPAFAGQIGRDLSESEAEDAARLTTLNLLATLQHGLGSLDVVDRIAQVRCFVVSSPTTTAHQLVPAAVARVLGEVFGSDRAGCYSTIGIIASVLDLPVTIDLVAAINPP